MSTPRLGERSFLGRAVPSRPVLCVFGTYLLVLAAVGSFSIRGDGIVYFAFLQRLFGDSPDGFAYQFGSALWDVPFYAAAKGFNHLTSVDLREASVGVATALAVLVTLVVGRCILLRLRLPAGGLALGLTFAGTPLWYYAVFAPSYTHVVDALAVSAAVLLLLRVLEVPSWQRAVALGLVFGALPVVRYANVAIVLGLLVPLLLDRQVRAAPVACAAALVTLVTLLAVPVVAGVPYGQANLYDPEGPARTSAFSGTSLDPSVPFRMLFSLHRGLFIWTPVSLAGAVGLIVLWRRYPEWRGLVAGFAGATVGLLVVYATRSEFWDGGWSFSQRLLTGLFPFVLVGVATLLRVGKRPAVVVMCLLAAWSVFIGLSHWSGHTGLGPEDGVDEVVAPYLKGERTPTELARFVGHRVVERWSSG